MSDSDRVALRGLKESSLGVTPASALNGFRFTGETLSQDVSTETSAEVSPDRQTTDIIRTGKEVGGEVNFESSYGSHDEYLAAALYSADWGAELTITAITISAANADNSFNDSGSGFPAFVAGHWIKVEGFTEAANNGYFQVVSAAAGKIVVGATLVTETAGDSVTIRGTAIRNGTTRSSFTLEKEFTDKTQFEYFKGCLVDALNLSFASRSILTGSFTFTGLTGGMEASTAGTGAPVASNENPILNASSNVVKIQEGGSDLGAGIYVKSLDLSLKNNARGRDAIGSLENVDYGNGSLDLSGKMIIYFHNNALYDKYLEDTASSWSVVVQDSAGNAMAYSVPQLKFTNGKVLVAGKNSDVMAEMEWTAYKDPTDDYTFQIDKWAA